MQKPLVRSRRLTEVLSLLFVLAIAVGGFFLRELGLALAFLMGTAIYLSLGSARPRAFCSGLCPRGRALGFALGPVSARLSLPAFMRSRAFRRFLCGSSMFFVVMSLFSLPSGWALPAWLGNVFWILCVTTLGLGLLLGLVGKPRAWCAICPLGTLQDTIREARSARAS